MTTIAEKHYNLKTEKSVQAMGSTSLHTCSKYKLCELKLSNIIDCE